MLPQSLILRTGIGKAMSNLNDDDLKNSNNDPRMRNGWAEYQRLVLAELERHNRFIEAINLKLGDIELKIALLKHDATKVTKNELRIDSLEKQIDKLNEGEIIEKAVNKYRNWLLSGGLLLLTAIILPVVRLFLGG